MQIQERFFAGKVFLPKAECRISNNKKLITVLTPWGQEAVSAKEVFENISSQYRMLSEDKESTHPFPTLMSLNPTQNDMRTTVMQVNQHIYSSVNQDEYSMGFELFFAVIVENVFTFIQVGLPALLIDRPHQNLCVIGQLGAPSLNIPRQGGLSPLPQDLLGVEEDISCHPFFFRFQPDDRLILLNRNSIPAGWFSLKRKDRTLESLSRLAAEENPNIPFYLALLELNG